MYYSMELLSCGIWNYLITVAARVCTLLLKCTGRGHFWGRLLPFFKNHKGEMMNARKSIIPSEAVIYAFAHTEAWLEAYAKSHQLPAHELTGQVAGLLLGSSSGEALGSINSVPALRRAPTKIHKATRKMEVASSARSNKTLGRKSIKRALSSAARTRISAAQKARWRRYHIAQEKAAA